MSNLITARVLAFFKAAQIISYAFPATYTLFVYLAKKGLSNKFLLVISLSNLLKMPPIEKKTEYRITLNFHKYQIRMCVFLLKKKKEKK